MKYSSAISEFRASVKRVGLKHSCLLAFSRIYDILFDMRLGVDTAARFELDELRIDEDTVSKGQMYQPTGVLAFRRVMKEMPLPPQPVLVDYGSGKGRTLLLAAMDPRMKRVVGVEFSKELVAIAENNISILRDQNKLRCPVDNVHVDATKYQYQDDENIFYFFYPFDDDIMQRVLAGIFASIDRNPRAAKIVYYYPVHADVLLRQKRLALDRRIGIYGYECLAFDVV